MKALADMLALTAQGKAMRGVPPDVVPPLRATLRVIPAYETAYRAALLGFERVLWLVRESPGGMATDAVLRDSTVKRLPRLLKDAAQGLAAAIEQRARGAPVSS